MRFEHATEIIRGVAFGPFSYVADARELLVGRDLAELNDLMQWFNDNLEEPERMVPFRDVGERRARRRKHEAMAQCWFREDAAAHIARARELVAILGRAGFEFVERPDSPGRSAPKTASRSQSSHESSIDERIVGPLRLATPQARLSLDPKHRRDVQS